MRVDQPRQDRCRAEIDHWNPGRNCDCTLRTNVNDSLTLNKNDLFGQHLACKAIEHPARANCDRRWRRWAWNYSAPGKHTRRDATLISPNTWINCCRWSFRCMTGV